MSYNLRAFYEHIDLQGTEHRVEILKLNFTGVAHELIGDGRAGVHTFNHEMINEEGDGLFKISENPIMSGKIDLHLLMRDDPSDPGTVLAADFAILEEIFESDEKEFIVVWKQNGTEFWRGKPLNDLLEYDEGPAPYGATITAKDFTDLNGVDYLDSSGNFFDERKTIIEVIADLLSYTGYDLQIRTATSWIEENGNNAEDYLRQNYIDTYPLRSYARNGDEPDEPITVFDALQQVLSDNKLILKQANNRFLIDQITAHENAEAVMVTDYSSSGAYISTSTVDRSIDFNTVNASDPKIIIGSKNRGYPAIKRASVRYAHRTTITNLQFPSNVFVEPPTSPRTFTQGIVVGSDTRINIQGNIITRYNQPPGNPSIRIGIESQNFHWDQIDGQWKPGSGTSDFDVVMLRDGETGRSYISINTEVLPESGTYKISFYLATPAAISSSYQDFSFKIREAVVEEGENTAIDFQLEQDRGFSVSYRHRDTFFGDGPTGYARGAIRFGTGDADLTSETWGRRGGTADKSFHENILREIIDPQRSWLQNLNAEVNGVYDPELCPAYYGNFFYYIGGSFSAYDGIWSPSFVRIQVEPTGEQDFSVIYRTEDVGGTGAALDTTRVLLDRNTTFSDSQKISETTASLSGTVTDIPIKAVGKNFIDVGDPFYLFNLSGASLTEFTLAEPQLPGATNLVVNPVTLDETIIPGSWVVFTGDRVAQFITRSDSGIRLGVRSYSQAVTEDGESYVDQDGNGYVFVDEGDQTAINQGTTAEIAILRGEIVLKATAGGQLALVRLDAKPESGSLVEIQADNINLQGLVTAINSGGSETQIDGGKIKADTSVIVGSGNNVAALTGAHPTVRMYAGNADPSAAPFRVLQDGTAVATKFVQLSGEEVDGVIEQFSIRDLLVTGALTIGTDGKLRTADDETVFGEDGIQFSTPETFTQKNSLVWVSDTHEDSYITAFTGGSIPRLEYKSNQHRFINDLGDGVFTIQRADAFGVATTMETDLMNISADRLPSSRAAAAAPGAVYAVQGSDMNGDYWTLRIRRTD